MNSSTKWVVLVCALAIVAIGVGAYIKSRPASETEQQGTISAVATSDYTYTSRAFGFSILVPQGWRVQEQTSGIAPSVTVYKAESEQPPQNVLGNVTHVSVVPLGMETGGIPPWTMATSTANGMNITTYLLSNGTPWAYSSTPVETPAGWKSWGFIYAAVEIQNPVDLCVRDGVEVPARECNALAGDTMQRSGTVSPIDTADIARIRQSITFTGR